MGSRRIPFAASLLALAVVSGVAWLVTPFAKGPVQSSEERRGATGDKAAGLAASGTATAGGQSVPPEVRAMITGVVRRDRSPLAASVSVRSMKRGVSTEAYEWVGDEATPAPPSNNVSAAESEIRTGADGRFSIQVAAPGTYWVLARDEQGHETSATVFCELAGSRTELILDLLSAGASLHGRVLYADGRPFRGLVVVHAPGFSPRDGASAGRAATDETGRFKAAGIAAGPNVVTVYEPGRMASTSAVIAVPHPGEFLFTFDTDVREWSGRIVDDVTGVGVAAARVVAHGNKGAGRSTYTAETKTGPDGAFSIRFARGYAKWIVEAPGFPRFVDWRTSLNASNPIELRLGRGHRVVGRVVRDGDSAPIGGISVFAQRTSIDRVAQARTDAGGRFQMEGLPTGWVFLAAHGLGWTTRGLPGSREASSLGVEVGERTTEVEIRVVRAGAIRGRVLDWAGAPVASATISTWPKERGMPADWAYSLASLPGVVTAADGTFRLETVIPGFSHVATATTPEGRTGEATTLVEADRDSVVEIRIESGRDVEVRCATKEGFPVASVAVTVTAAAGAWKTEETDATGTARLGPLPSGALEVEVKAPEGYVVVGEDKQTSEDGAGSPVASFLLRAKKRVVGRVLWADGSPAQKAYVAVGPEGAVIDQTRTDVAGTFEFDDFDASEVRVSVFDGVRETALAATVVRPGAADVDIRLTAEAPPRTKVRVVGPDGKPVPEGTASILAPDDDGATFTDNYLKVVDGECDMRLPVGKTWIRVSSWAVDAGPVTFGPVQPGAREVVVNLPIAREIAGVVRDSSGRGAGGVRLQVMPVGLPSAFSGVDERQTVRTDSAGRFRVGHLAAGDHQLDITAPPGVDSPEPAVVEAGRHDLSFVLGPVRRTTLKVMDFAGQPLFDADVTVKLPDRRELRASTDPSGAALILGADAGTAEGMTLSVEPPRERPDLLGRENVGWRVSETEFRLGRAFPVRGVVRDETGRPVAAQVSYRAGGAEEKTISTAVDGAFVLAHIPEGTVTLWASSRTPPREGDALVVDAGAASVGLTIERTATLRVQLEGLAGGGGWDAWVKLVEVGTKHELDADADDVGAAEVHGLRRAKTYTLVAYAERAGEANLVGRVENVLGTADRAVVRMVPTLTIRGQVLLPPGWQMGSVEATDGVQTFTTDVSTQGTFVLTELAAGRWRVRVMGRVGTALWTASAEVDAGGAVTLEPKPR